MHALALRISALSLGALSLAACGSSGSDPFIGTYDYTESNTFTITGPMAGPAMAGTASGTLTVAASTGGYLLTIEPPADAGGGSCALKATAGSDTSLAFASGQTCAVSGMGATGTATLTSGTGTLAGTTLTLHLAYDISGSSPAGAFTATTVDDDTATKQ
jgi:hypothetical protein